MVIITRCADFYKKWEKEPNWCEKCKSTVSLINSYLDLVAELNSRGIDREIIYAKFPETAARPVFKIKDPEIRNKTLNYTCSCLNRSEKVQAGDLQNLISAYNKEQKPEKHVEDRPEEFAKVNNEAQTKPEIEIPIQSVKVPEREKVEKKQAPCMSGKPCPSGTNYNKADANGKNRKCDKWGAFINQLPDDECWFDADERKKKKEAALGFTTALDMARPVAVNPYVIKPVQLTKEQAEEKLTEIVRGYLTPTAQRSWEFAKKAGLHESNLDLFQFFVDGIEVQDTDMAEEARA